ncbi:MAG: hypothetical protein AB7U30_13515, partial [Sulfuricellaceae bacterium]
MINLPNPSLNGGFSASSRQIDPVQPWLGTHIACFQAVFPPLDGIRADFALHMLRIPPARQAAYPNQVVGGKAQERLTGQFG